MVIFCWCWQRWGIPWGPPPLRWQVQAPGNCYTRALPAGGVAFECNSPPQLASLPSSPKRPSQAPAGITDSRACAYAYGPRCRNAAHPRTHQHRHFLGSAADKPKCPSTSARGTSPHLYMSTVTSGHHAAMAVSLALGTVAFGARAHSADRLRNAPAVSTPARELA